MSNVLIGIIGVILFIGLALAGALFLGPRFQESTQNSKAAAQVQQAKQVADAYDLWLLQEGGKLPMDGHDPATLPAGYLKSIPEGFGVFTWPQGSASYKFLGSDDAAARICEAIQRQTGQIKSGQAFNGGDNTIQFSLASVSVGCVRNGLVSDSARFAVFAKL